MTITKYNHLSDEEFISLMQSKDLTDEAQELLNRFAGAVDMIYDIEKTKEKCEALDDIEDSVAKMRRVLKAFPGDE